ncbi:MAG: TonB-dependent receptor plug domain-containing protein, partial [Pseudomonadota bacterium]
MIQRNSAAAAAGIVCLTIAASAAAQNRSNAIEEVVVFAQKRAESVQDVPVAVSPITAQQIEDANIVDITDLGFLAPNTQLQAVSTFPGFANFTIRGIGVSTSIRTLDPAVNVFTDGIVLGTQIGAVLDVFDVEAVEVLRGPQGIFFGRNSTGGAVVFRTARPTEEFQGSTKLTVGSHRTGEIETIVQGPLNDTLRAKLAVQLRRSDGMFEDNNGGTFAPAPNNPNGTQPENPQKDQSGQESIFIKPTITFQPSDDFDYTLFGQFYNDDGGGSATKAYIDPRLASPPLLTLFGYTPPDDQFDINHNLLGESKTQSWHLIGEGNWTIGNNVLTSVTGIREVTFDSSLDVDGAPFTLIHFPNNEEEASQFSQELRYAMDISDRVDL